MNTKEYEALAEQARKTNLLEFFRRSGYETERRGSEYYVKDFPGLCINPDTNQWFSHYTGRGATNNSVNCLVTVLEMDFRQAVYELTGQDVTNSRSAEYPKAVRPQHTSPPKPVSPETHSKELMMPEQSSNMRKVFAYLCRTRGIPAAVVEELAHAKLLYQTEKEFIAERNGETKTYLNANAVFVHRDAEGTAIGAEIQGCSSFRRYKGVAPGTGESVFQFVPVPMKDGKVTRAFLFESAIDLLSFYTLCADKKNLSGTVLVSMAGLKPTVPMRMQESGIEVISCVDNDDAGRRFERENGFLRTARTRELLDENGIKDWNDLLILSRENPDILTRNREPERRLFHAGGRQA